MILRFKQFLNEDTKEREEIKNVDSEIDKLELEVKIKRLELLKRQKDELDRQEQK